MNVDLIKEILMVAIAASIISTATIQKIKEALTNKKWLYLVGIAVSLVVGVTFSLSFTELNFVNSIWVGVVTWIGADACYKAFENKIFKPMSDMKKVTRLERSDK